jgi:NAD(P)-dependent dehydrogenase (short-subunit alcohol dehydrogenase family)
MSESLLGLEDKVVVVTGSSQGVGLGCARQFARAGSDVVLVGRRSKPLESAAEEIRALGRQVLTVEADVTREEDIAKMVEASMGRFGRIDVAINNVGGRRGKPDGALLDSGPEYWRQTLELNLDTVFACTQAFARAMISTGTSGAIVNIASVTAYKSSPNLAPYGAAKAGLIQLTRTLALELAPHGIRVTGVAPGMVHRHAGRSRPGRPDDGVRSRRLGLWKHPGCGRRRDSRSRWLGSG